MGPANHERRARAAALAAVALVALGAIAARAVNADEAARWRERLQRLPLPVWSAPDRASLATGGGEVQRTSRRATLRERLELPEGGPVIAFAQCPPKAACLAPLVLATFDGGAFAVEDGTLRPLRLGARVNAVTFTEEGELYAATDEGLFRQEERIAAGSFADVTWWRGRVAAVSPRGLSLVEAGGLRTLGSAQGLTAQSPAVVAPCEEALCIGAVDGVWTYDGRGFSHRSSASGDLPTDHVTAVASQAGTTWLGTFEGGLARWSAGSVRRVAPSDGLPDGRVQPRALVAVGGGAVVGTPSGLLWVEGGRAGPLGIELPEKEATALAVASAGGLWVGHRRGAVRVELEGAP